MPRPRCAAHSSSTPELVRPDPLRLLVVAHRQLELEVVEAEVAQHRDDELEDARRLGLQLVLGDEEVRVVLRESAHAREAVQGAGQLVAVDRAVLGEAQRQVAVAAARSL
jgi:hypothetical protein